VGIGEQHAVHSQVYLVSDTRPGSGSLILGGPEGRVGVMAQEPLDQLFVVQGPAEIAQVLGTGINLKDAEPIAQGGHKRSNQTINIPTHF
jgi:hypothetical protein